MKQYIYKSLNLSITDSEFDDTINIWGIGGWRVISIIEHGTVRGNKIVKVVFEIETEL